MLKRLPLPAQAWIKPRLYHLLAPLLALLLMDGFGHTSLGGWMSEFLEDQTISLRFKARAPFDPPAASNLVFLGVDQQSLDRFGKWSWRRNVIANFLNDVYKTDQTPHTIAFDIMYTEASLEHPEDDQALGDAASNLPSLITGALSVQPSTVSTTNPDFVAAAEAKTAVDLQKPGYTLPFTLIHGDIQKIQGSNIATLPIEQLRTQSLFGFVNDDPSPVDGIRHTIPLLIRVRDRIYPSLALQALCQALDVDADKVEINIGKNVILKNSSGQTWTIPVNERGDYTINYRNNSSFTATYSFSQVADALSNHLNHGKALPPEFSIRNKIVLFGEDATALGDNGPTPLLGSNPLPFTHLNVINNVLQNDYLSFVPWYWVVIGWSLVTWPTLLRVKDAPLIEAVFVPIGILVLYVLGAFLIFGRWSLLISLSWPVISYGAVNFWAVILRWREEQQGREQIKQVFSQMLSPEVMGHLLDHPENVKLGGSERAVTILFSDIRDYTKFSEGLAPSEVVRQLNLYFERMVDCVKKCRGTLHKYIGDAIMVAWGDIAAASLGPKKDAQNAVRSALMMRVQLRELNEERREQGLSPLRIGIGLNHGTDVLVGLIGASSRSEFTVMGDPVNTASRLEGITKEFHTDLAISESVRLLIGDDFLVRRLGFIQLKGKTKATVVYEVLAEKNDLATSKLTPEFVALYEKTFELFLTRHFAEAEAGFLECEKLFPGDYCVSEYLKACREFAVEPPPPDWDGRIVMKSK